jgi:hypothetical protein
MKRFVNQVEVPRLEFGPTLPSLLGTGMPSRARKQGLPDITPIVWCARFFPLVVLILLFHSGSWAASLSFTGSLDTANPNDVFLGTFALSVPSPVRIQAWGYGGTANAPGGTNAAGKVIPAGGFDSYISLFTGTGAGASFVTSNDDGSCPPGAASPACYDSSLAMMLPAGTYTVAVSLFSNFSFAENLGTGILGDGFIGLGNYFDAASQTVRSSNYAVDVKITVNATSLTQITQTGFARNRLTGVWFTTMTVTNTSKSSLDGPIQVVLTNLSNGALMNGNGMSGGSPYVTISAGALAPGGSASLMLQFSNPSNGLIAYTPVTYSGGLL